MNTQEVLNEKVYSINDIYDLLLDKMKQKHYDNFLLDQLEVEFDCAIDNAIPDNCENKDYLDALGKVIEVLREKCENHK